MARSEHVALAALLVASAAAAPGCNAIAGLGAFYDVPGEAGSEDSSPGPIVDDAGEAGTGADADATVDAVADATIDTGIDATEDGQGYTAPEAGPAVDYRWPRWIMPNGASTSDAALPSYSAISSSDGGVKDDVTGLEWGNVTSGVGSLASATTTCGPPWRLPTRIELVSILDTSSSSTALVNPRFTTMLPDRFWTSSVTPAGASWTVDFGEGTIAPGVSGQAVICIYVGDTDGGT